MLSLIPCRVKSKTQNGMCRLAHTIKDYTQRLIASNSKVERHSICILMAQCASTITVQLCVIVLYKPTTPSFHKKVTYIHHYTADNYNHSKARIMK